MGASFAVKNLDPSPFPSVKFSAIVNRFPLSSFEFRHSSFPAPPFRHLSFVIRISNFGLVLLWRLDVGAWSFSTNGQGIFHTAAGKVNSRFDKPLHREPLPDKLTPWHGSTI
jgi:hypothetical protein